MLPDYQLTPHFKLSEFRCHCCGTVDTTAALLLARRLEPIRDVVGVMIIDSGFRCPANNQAVGGKKDSAHLLGLAADIACTNDADRYLLTASLLAHGFKRLGIAKTSVHADIKTSPVPVIWTYYP
jgi:hypothetical protein